MTARPRRALGTILVLSGMLPWVIATLSLIPVEASLGAISGGALVVGGIMLIASSVRSILRLPCLHSGPYLFEEELCICDLSFCSLGQLLACR